jgi:hypothetical protein
MSALPQSEKRYSAFADQPGSPGSIASKPLERNQPSKAWRPRPPLVSAALEKCACVKPPPDLEN